MGVYGVGDFEVRVRNKEVVAAVQPLEVHLLPLSNLGLLMPPLDFSVFFCYTINADINTSIGSMVDVLKKSMAKALVSYYALAGEVVTNSVGEPELLCNNRGVDFIEAFADIELCHLNFYKADENIRGKLIPYKSHGVLSVQVTELKCGGLVVACTFDHRIADAYSANMFLVSWTEMAQSKPLSVLPTFSRSLLSPRHPVCLDPSIDDICVSMSALPASIQSHLTNSHYTSRLYHVKADHLNELQSLASSDGCKRTKLEAFSAFLWKLAAQCAKCNRAKIAVVVDGRTRLSAGDSDMATQMSSFFGNAVSIPCGEQNVTDLASQALSWVANEVHGLLEKAATKNHFLSLIDWVEAHRPETPLYKIITNETDDEPALVVSSGQRFPICKVDFGWGKPAFASYYMTYACHVGYVMLMPSAAVDGDWVVYMFLLKEQIQFFETEAANVLKPLTSDYLDQITSL